MYYLFTYKNKENEELNIPNTTNGCDGKFGRVKIKLKNHSGLKVDRKSKMFNKLMWNQVLFFLIKPIILIKYINKLAKVHQTST